MPYGIPDDELPTFQREAEDEMFADRLADRGLKIGDNAIYTPITGAPYGVTIVGRCDWGVVVRQGPVTTTLQLNNLEPTSNDLR